VDAQDSPEETEDRTEEEDKTESVDAPDSVRRKQRIVRRGKIRPNQWTPRTARRKQRIIQMILVTQRGNRGGTVYLVFCGDRLVALPGYPSRGE